MLIWLHFLENTQVTWRMGQVILKPDASCLIMKWSCSSDCVCECVKAEDVIYISPYSYMTVWMKTQVGYSYQCWCRWVCFLKQTHMNTHCTRTHTHTSVGCVHRSLAWVWVSSRSLIINFTSPVTYSVMVHGGLTHTWTHTPVHVSTGCGSRWWGVLSVRGVGSLFKDSSSLISLMKRSSFSAFSPALNRTGALSPARCWTLTNADEAWKPGRNTDLRVFTASILERELMNVCIWVCVCRGEGR